MPTIPYESATSGDKAIAEIQAILAKFQCQTFGVMTDAENQKTIIQFKWRGQQISLEASWRGYAAAYLKAHPYNVNRMRKPRAQYEGEALAQAKIAVCSILRDWVKGQVTAIECGVMSFGAAFMPHMLLPNGERLIDHVTSTIQLPCLENGAKPPK